MKFISQVRSSIAKILQERKRDNDRKGPDGRGRSGSLDMDYIPATENDKKEMLMQIGVRTIDDLMVDLKPQISEELGLSEPMSKSSGMPYEEIVTKKQDIKVFYRCWGLQSLRSFCNQSSFNAWKCTLLATHHIKQKSTKEHFRPFTNFSHLSASLQAWMW